ncbi:hypothetical protein HK099_006419 [Clydaea vesicula]|uniref:Septin-type G domain-containing protein n=1 Tax=Clydaea vesicula TaxID=447962 RepID=A0AAD5TXN7_9FUNG|nr:hypothetical protein HK099_006419 [Clydaea vesicula]
MDLKNLDYREKDYIRTKIELKNITLLEVESKENFQEIRDLLKKGNVIVWAYYIPEESPLIHTPSFNIPIPLTYLDCILSGCLKISKNFARQFILNTEGWSHLLDDRTAHPSLQKYALALDLNERGPCIHQKRDIDSLLKELLADFVESRLIAGHTNSGKSNFIKTIYHTLDVKKLHFPENVEESEDIFPDEFITSCTPLLAKIEFLPATSNEKILLKLIDSPGLPIPVAINKRLKNKEDFTDLANSYVLAVTKFVESQYEATLLEESKVKRNAKAPDYQIHACIYLLDASVVESCGGLTPIDRIVLTKLTQILNVIPCIGKADLISTKHLSNLKKLVMKDIVHHQIPIQTFQEPLSDSEDDELSDTLQGANTSNEYAELLPFAIINGEEEDFFENNDGVVKRWTLERNFPWGTASVENPEHCDFVKLNEALFGTFCQELKDITREVYYEQWRTQKLLEVRGSVINDTMNKN